MNERLILYITDLNQHGQGVGQDEHGFVHFVDGALPGEKVAVTIVKKTNAYAVSTLEEIIEVSEDRVDPPCPVFERCGGCSLQHLSYEAELKWKESRVLSALERIGKIDTSKLDVQPIIGMKDPWRYRNKASYPIAGTSDDPITGFYAKRSHEVVPHDDCLLLTQATNEIKKTVLRLIKRDGIEPYDEKTHQGVLRHVVIRHAFASDQLMLIFIVKTLPDLLKTWPEEISNELSKTTKARLSSAYAIENEGRSNTILKGRSIHLYADQVISESLNDLTFRLRPEAFFQVNTRQAEKLFTIVGAWAKEALKDKERQHALDLYCGSGSIALHVARSGISVRGVEIVPGAIDEARAAAFENNISGADFVAADIATYIKNEGVKTNVSLVILDPPRKGLDQRLLDALKKAQHVQTILYVSCNPATLARDINDLKETFIVKKLQTVDMFPHTTHVETVVLMSRVDK